MRGLLLLANQEPAETPVWLCSVYGAGWWLLGDDGLLESAAGPDERVDVLTAVD